MFPPATLCCFLGWDISVYIGGVKVMCFASASEHPDWVWDWDWVCFSADVLARSEWPGLSRYYNLSVLYNQLVLFVWACWDFSWWVTSSWTCVHAYNRGVCGVCVVCVWCVCVRECVCGCVCVCVCVCVVCVCVVCVWAWVWACACLCVCECVCVCCVCVCVCVWHHLGLPEKTQSLLFLYTLSILLFFYFLFLCIFL